MVFYVTREPDKFHQISIEELYSEDDENSGWERINTDNNTHTVMFEGEISDRIKKRVDVSKLIDGVRQLNQKIRDAGILEQDRQSLYHTYFIPKQEAGKWRRIDEPEPVLKQTLREIADFLRDEFRVTHHTAAFAYIKQRDTMKCMRRHQQNESKWYAKFDLSGFFPSTTLEFLLQQLGMIFPYSEVMNDEQGRQELTQLLEVCFLNGGLPQGSPASPFLTNIMMIPVDYLMSRYLRNFHGIRYIYTRYADDFQISNKVDFDVKQVENLLIEVLNQFNAPFTLNAKKTRYGSTAGRNWNLGIMINQDNMMTIGRERKRHIKKMIHAYILDKRAGVNWDPEFIRKLWGDISYMGQVEPQAERGLLMWVNSKYHFDLLSSFKADLAAAVA